MAMERTIAKMSWKRFFRLCTWQPGSRDQLTSGKIGTWRLDFRLRYRIIKLMDFQYDFQYFNFQFRSCWGTAEVPSWRDLSRASQGRHSGGSAWNARRLCASTEVSMLHWIHIVLFGFFSILKNIDIVVFFYTIFDRRNRGFLFIRLDSDLLLKPWFSSSECVPSLFSTGM